MNDVNKKIVTVTGSTTGVGKTIALELFKSDATIVITGRKP